MTTRKVAIKRREFVKLAAGTVFIMMDPAKIFSGAADAKALTGANRIPGGNPIPAVFELPNGPHGPDAAVARLSLDSGGKTPTPKNFTAHWVGALAERGAPKVYTAANSANFQYIGMPVGGIGAGQVYLGGDGKLWWWDIFNTRGSVRPNDQYNAYVAPYHEDDPTDPRQYAIEQGFVLRVGSQIQTLDKRGFSDIEFVGQYPIGTTTYKDAALPVTVKLEAFSPFVPLNIADSSLPATLMQYTVTNHSAEPVRGEIAGWLENAICIQSGQAVPGVRTNTVQGQPGITEVSFRAADIPVPAGGAAANPAPPTVFEDWERGTYDGWTVTGTAFGTRPAKKGEIFHSEAVQNEQGAYMADSFFGGSDSATGTLTSKAFPIIRPFINILIGGGYHPGVTCVNLKIDGRVVRTATGHSAETLGWASWNVAALHGKTAQIEIVDNESGGWGHILVDTIELADTSRVQFGGSGDLKSQRDFGTMTLAALGGEASARADVHKSGLPGSALSSPGDQPSGASREMALALDTPLLGSVSQPFALQPGHSAMLTFVIAWHFPNPDLLGLKTDMRREYAARFESASDFVGYVQKNLARLTHQTQLWRETWYDSTLPHWFLDRTFLNTSILATSTSYRLYDGRFYGYEGMYSCPGTCTHVWGYVQAMPRLFPELNKSILAHDHLLPGIGLRDDGGIPARSELGDDPAVDGQSDVVLRSYLAHQTSPDAAFLKQQYPQIKRALDYLRNTNDPGDTGTLIGSQHNTLDAEYFTRGAWLSINYQAALRAMAAMAAEMDDTAYAETLRRTADRGREYTETRLFNGEYFFQEHDPKYPDSTGTFNGCEYSQLVGQNWLYQVGLGPAVAPAKTKTALNSIWRYSFTTDVGPFTKEFGTGRPFVLPGEGGILGCSWPRGNDSHNVAYLSECQTGYEYACTAAMMWEGLVDKALAHTRTVHERYDGAKRNPWNEVEAGSHYSRAMTSYALFTAVCGFEYHGPHGSIAFVPRLSPESFQAPFTTAEGWGTFTQKRIAGKQHETIAVKYGRLRLRTLAFALASDAPLHAGQVTVHMSGRPVPATAAMQGRRLVVTLASDVHLTAGQSLEVTA